MYMLKDNVTLKFNQVIASKVIGLAQPTISNILNRKVACRKVVAYCITKYVNEDANIEDFFEKVD